jgi:Zn-dependent protease with chaperone function
MSPLLLAPFAAAFVAFALAGACAVGLAGRVALGLRPARWHSPLTWTRAAMVLAPVTLAVLGCVALAFPEPYAGCHCDAHGLHHPHLCVNHPAFALPLIVPAACVLVAWLALVAPRVLCLMRAAIASSRRVQAVRRLPIERLDGVALRIANCGERIAFTAGALSPVIVVDRRLWAALTDEERRAVVHHEQGHVERRDGLTLLALRLCTALFPMPAGRRLLDAWRAGAESACDLYAASALGDAAAVAGALVAVERIRARGGAEDASTRDETMDVMGGKDEVTAVGACGDLERRVLVLLDRGESAVSDALLGNDMFAAAAVSLGAAALTIAWPRGAFHHAVETAIGFVIH